MRQCPQKNSSNRIAYVSTEISKCGASIKVFSTHAVCLSFSLLKGENSLCCIPSLRQPVKEGAIQGQKREETERAVLDRPWYR